MVQQFPTEDVTDIEFRLLSVASLIKRVHDGITIDDLYRDAERKFDTLIELLSDTYTDNTILSKFGYSLDDLKQVSLLIFNLLISDADKNPFITLCVLEGSSLEVIKSRRNMLLHIFHPDRHWSRRSNESNTRRINEAYDKIEKLYDKTDIQFTHNQTNIPPSYPYKYQAKRNMRLAVLLIISFSLVALWGIINFIY